MLIKCITRSDMRFGDYFIPVRTKAIAISDPVSTTVDAPGVYLKIYINLFDMFSEEKRMTGVPANKTRINNELEGKPYGCTSSQMIGIVVSTNAKQVYMDAGSRFYQNESISGWKAEKIFPDGIPGKLTEGLKETGYRYRLVDIIEYLGEEFAKWVQKKCQFHTLTEDDIENGIDFEGAKVGDKILSDLGHKQFSEKQFEYQERLEAIGFTYEFSGGLIWD